MVKKKWYNYFWVRILGVVVFIIAIYFAAQKTVTYYNLQEYLKTEIETLKKQNSSLDSLYLKEKAEKERIKLIKDRIQVWEDLERIKLLEKEIEELKKQKVKPIEPLSPEDLDKYFRKIVDK